MLRSRHHRKLSALPNLSKSFSMQHFTPSPILPSSFAQYMAGLPAFQESVVNFGSLLEIIIDGWAIAMVMHKNFDDV